MIRPACLHAQEHPSFSQPPLERRRLPNTNLTAPTAARPSYCQHGACTWGRLCPSSTWPRN
eukprot:10889688-Lingulodinium_polyedra.AAC.1